MEGDKFVEVEHLTVGYESGRPVLNDVSLEIARGEFVCILGPSGCGKSTLLNVLSGLMPPGQGRIKVGGVDLYGGAAKGSHARLGFVFQDHRLLPWRTVRDNIAFALRAAGIPRGEHDAIIDRYLRMLHIREHIDAWPLNLSGGQRQRVSIARALAIDPLYVLMDEPYSTLDEVTARAMREELLQVWADSGKTIIFVTHSIREAVFLADRVFAMTANPGRLYRTIDVDIPRIRSYTDVRLAEIEAELIEDLLVEWGMASKKNGNGAAPNAAPIGQR